MIATTPTPTTQPAAKRPSAGQRRRARRQARGRAGPLAADRALAGSPAVLRPARTVGLGLLWAALLFAAAAGGAALTAVLLIPVAVVAALSGVRAQTGMPVVPAKRQAGDGLGVSPTMVIAVTPAAVLPLAALAGGTVALVFGTLLVVGAVALLVAASGPRLPYGVLLAAFCPAVAAASVVVALGQGLAEALTLLAAVCLYDMASFLTGTGPLGGLVGVVAGWLTVGVLAVLVAAVVVPPYSGRNPWVLLGLVAALAPAGVLLCSRIGKTRLLPAVRRLDSLVLAGPAWVVAVGLLLHR
jgi:hypothetical protein